MAAERGGESDQGEAGQEDGGSIGASGELESDHEAGAGLLAPGERVIGMAVQAGIVDRRDLRPAGEPIGDLDCARFLPIDADPMDSANLKDPIPNQITGFRVTAQ